MFGYPLKLLGDGDTLARFVSQHLILIGMSCGVEKGEGSKAAGRAGKALARVSP